MSKDIDASGLPVYGGPKSQRAVKKLIDSRGIKRDGCKHSMECFLNTHPLYECFENCKDFEPNSPWETKNEK